MMTLKELQEHFDLNKDDIDRCKISPVFWTFDSKWAFQQVGGYYRLYNGKEGDFVEEFRSFKALNIYIAKH